MHVALASRHWMYDMPVILYIQNNLTGMLLSRPCCKWGRQILHLLKVSIPGRSVMGPTLSADSGTLSVWTCLGHLELAGRPAARISSSMR